MLATEIAKPKTSPADQPPTEPQGHETAQQRRGNLAARNGDPTHAASNSSKWKWSPRRTSEE